MAEKGDIRLDLNENFFLPAEYYDSITDDISPELSTYPSENCKELREDLAEFYDLNLEQFVVGNGSDEILDTLFKSMVSPQGKMGYYVPSYEFLEFFAERNDRETVSIPLKSDFSVPVPGHKLEELDSLIICSPNNPTGLMIDEKHLRAILENGLTVVLDQAYGEYAQRDYIDLLKDFSNLVIVRTFSKAWGLAGIRVGYSISSPETSMRLRDHMIPFSTNSISSTAARSALKHADTMKGCVERTVEERSRLLEELSEHGFNSIPSEANFLLSRPPASISPGKLEEELERRQIMIKTFEMNRLKNYVRITVGNPEMNVELIDALEDIL